MTVFQRWKQLQSRPVILGDIMDLFHKLERLDILQELEKKTGVKFNRDEENGDSAGIMQGETLPDQARHITAFNDNNQNMNVPIQKKSEIYLKQMPDDDGEIRPIGDDIIDDCKKNEMFIPYKREDIEYRHSPDLENGKKDVQIESKVEEVIYTRNLSREISDPSNSKGFLCHDNSQNEYDPIQTEENNLNRSISTCSSNTENNSYDSIPVTRYENKLQSGDENIPPSLQVCNIDNDEDKLNNGENSFAMPEGMTTVAEMVNVHEKVGTNRVSKVKEFDEHLKDLGQHKNVLQKKQSSTISDTDAEELIAKFQGDKFQEKILKNWQTYSDVISQCDPSEPGEVSEKIFCSSEQSALDDNIKICQGHMENFCASTDYVDHSLLDEEANRPKLASLRGEMQSLQKKAEKPLPGQHLCYVSNDNPEYENSFDNNPTGSFQIEWQLSSLPNGDFTAVSIDGETEGIPLEQTSLENHQSEQPLDNAVEEAEFTRRGPSVADQFQANLESDDSQLQTNDTDTNSSNTNLRSDFNHETESSEISTHENMWRTRLFNDTNDPMKSICSFVKLVYDSSL